MDHSEGNEGYHRPHNVTTKGLNVLHSPKHLEMKHDGDIETSDDDTLFGGSQRDMNEHAYIHGEFHEITADGQGYTMALNGGHG